MATTSNPRTTPWNAPYTPAPLAEGQSYPSFTGMIIPGISDVKSYSLRNGTPEEIEPYLLTAAVPAMFHWIPMNGVSPENAIRCIDGYIKCYLYTLTGASAASWNQANTRMAAIILGTSRAVMTNNYDLTLSDINSQELASPMMNAVFPPATTANPNPAPTYTVLLANNTPNITLLTDNLTLSAEEMELVRNVLRASQAIIPLQGLNLINDGHHYLSDKSKQAYKSFLAVEKQLWVSPYMKGLVSSNGDLLRDLMWHKSGHPVAISIKENAATSTAVKENLSAAKLGSATARLPAMEADIRAADTFLKVMESVDAVWATMAGSISLDVFRLRIAAVKAMPRSIENLPQAVDLGGGISVTTRTAAINALKAMVTKNEDKVAMVFGFYMAMMEAAAGDIGGTNTDTLRNANSLNRLRRNNVAAFVNGAEIYKDYRAQRAAARQAGDVAMPTLFIDT